MHSKVIIAALVFGLGVGLNVGVKNNASASHGLVKDENCDVVEHVECDHDHEHEHVYQKNLQINRAPASSTVRPDLFITRSRTGSFNGSATWYTFTAPFEGRFWFESTSSNVDPIAQIYLGPNTSYSTVSVDAGNRDDISSSNRNFRFALDMHTAETYYIQVREYYNRTGSYTIRAYHNHDYTYRSTYYTSTTHKKFCSCGEYTTASLNVDDTMNGHGRNMVHCANCDTWIDLIPSDHTHSYSTCSYSSQNYHRWICDCGATYLAAHSYDSTYNIGDYQVKHCSVCNAWVEVLRPHTHSYTNSYTYANDGKHNAVCSCGQSIKQVHTFDSYLPYGHGHNDMIHCSKCNANVELGVLTPGSTLSGSIPNDGAKWHIFKPESSGSFTFSLASSSDARMDFYYGQYPTSITDTFHTENIGRVSFTRTVNGGENVFIRVTENNWGSASYSLSVTASIPTNPFREWTIMVYACGSSLTSFESANINDMINVPNQPSDVNVIIETGGSPTSWGIQDSTGSYIPYNKIGRFNIRNNTLYREYDFNDLTDENMGAKSTFESFLNWGFSRYPAEHFGVILINHGGGLVGVCRDDRHGGDVLTNSETASAFANAFAQNGINYNLDFIGYDACMMQLQDVAEFNSHYFNYMLASQIPTSELGWGYAPLLENIYNHTAIENNPSTYPDGVALTALKQTARNFVTNGYSWEQTLSVLDLTQMASYLNAFELLADSIIYRVAHGALSPFTIHNSILNTFDVYGETSYGNGDCIEMLNKLEEETGTGLLARINAVRAFFPNNGNYDPYYFNTTINGYEGCTVAEGNGLVRYYAASKGRAGNAPMTHGLAVYIGVSSYELDYVYPETETNFTRWRDVVTIE